MPFQGHGIGAIEPFVWVGLGIGGRWLYGVLFDAPAASASALIVTGTMVGTACYALTVIVPIVVERLRGE